MQSGKPILSPGPKDSRRENARRVDALFNRSETTALHYALTLAATTGTARISDGQPKRLEDLPDEVCTWCAKPFEQRTWNQIYCSPTCRNAAKYDECEGWRARRREVLTCRDCGAPIGHLAKHRHKSFCDTCRRKRYLKRRQADYAERIKPAIVAERERAIAERTCLDCGVSLAGIAQRLSRKRCERCRIKLKRATGNLARNRRAKERARAGAPSAEPVNCTASTAQRLMKIASTDALSKPAHVQLLPPSWGTLYEFTKLPEDKLEVALVNLLDGVKAPGKRIA
jgi:hypothetical protein